MHLIASMSRTKCFVCLSKHSTSLSLYLTSSVSSSMSDQLHCRVTEGLIRRHPALLTAVIRFFVLPKDFYVLLFFAETNLASIAGIWDAFCFCLSPFPKALSSRFAEVTALAASCKLSSSELSSPSSTLLPRTGSSTPHTPRLAHARTSDAGVRKEGQNQASLLPTTRYHKKRPHPPKVHKRGNPLKQRRHDGMEKNAPLNASRGIRPHLRSETSKPSSTQSLAQGVAVTSEKLQHIISRCVNKRHELPAPQSTHHSLPFAAG